MIRKEEEEVFKDCYDIIGDPIGMGGFGEIHKAKNKKTNEYRAIKIIDKGRIRAFHSSKYFKKMTEEEMNTCIDRFKNEIEYMKIMEGKNKENINTVKYYEYFNTQKEFIIVMELCDFNLNTLLQKKEKGFNVNEIYNILNQLNNSFRIMNENKIVHRDLKLENILIKYENKDKYIVKLTDYGISKQLLNLSHLSTKVGTLKYEAPEIMEETKNYNEKCDLWSLGIIIYILCFRKFPFKGETQISLLNSIKKEKNILKKLIIKN